MISNNRYKFIDEAGKHLHTLDSKPLLGTTTVISETLQKGGLTYWASGMCAEKFGWLNPKKHTKEEVLRAAKKGLDHIANSYVNEIYGNEYKDWIKYLDEAYRAHNTKKEARAVEGTDLHELCSKWIDFVMSKPGYSIDFSIEPIGKWVDWCDKNVKRFLFSEIHCYSEQLWVGGGVDLAYESMTGEYVLADIKSRDKVYFSDFVQCGGYEQQLMENSGLDKDGNLVWDKSEIRKDSLGFDAHAIFGLGENFKEPVISRETEKNRQAFEHCMNLHKLKRGFEEQ